MPQSHARVPIHVVFATRRRQPFIRAEVEADLFAYMAAILKAQGSPACLWRPVRRTLHVGLKPHWPFYRPFGARCPMGTRFQGLTALATFLRPLRGLVIGNLTSQFFGNAYLDPLDHHVTDQLGFGMWVRYSDDAMVFGEKSALRELVGELRAFLGALRLALNEPRAKLIPVAGGPP